MANTTVKGKFNVVAENGDVQTIYPKTTGDQVLVDRDSNASVIPNDVANLQHIVNKMGSLAFKSKVETNDFTTGTMISSLEDLKSNTDTGKIADATVVKDIESRVDTLENSNLVTVDELDAGLATKPDTEINDSVTSTSLTWSSKKLSDHITTLNSNTQLLNSRVNNLATLSEGSTTGDAELIDIRTGYDSTNYSSAGEAVRAQILNINNFYKHRVSEFEGKLNLFNKDTFIPDCEINRYTGEYIENNKGYGVSDFIPVNAGDELYFSRNGSSFNVTFLYRYDINKNIINNGSATTINNYIIPAGTAFIRVCIKTIEISDFQIELDSISSYKPFITLENIFSSLNEDIDTINEDIDTINNDINGLNNFYKHRVSEFEGKLNLFNKDTFIPDCEINSVSGIEMSNDKKYGVSDFIPVNAGDELYFSRSGVEDTVTYLYTYDKTFQYKGRPGTLIKTFTVSEGVSFIRVCIQNSHISDFQIELDEITAYKPFITLENIFSSLNEDIDTINEDIGTINEDIGTINEDIGTINNDIDTINNDINGLNNFYKHRVSEFEGKLNLFNKDTFIPDCEINRYTGEYIENNKGYGVSDFIPVNAGDELYFSKNSTEYTVTFLYRYDINKNIINNGSATTINNYIIPAGTAFIRVCIYKYDINSFQIELDEITAYKPFITLENVYESTQTNKNKVDLVTNKFSILNSIISKNLLNLFNKDTFIPDCEINSVSGIEMSNDKKYGVSDFIPVNAGDELYFSRSGVEDTVTYLYTYDKTFQYKGRPGTLIKTFTVSEGVSFIRVCIQNSHISDFQIELDEITAYKPYGILKNAFSSSVEHDDEPLHTIEDYPTFLSCFLNVGCIGDSLASGVAVYKDSNGNTVVNSVNRYEYSWGQYLARMTGNKYYNWSKGGLRTDTFLSSSYAAECFDGNHLCQAYIIGLGQNDNNASQGSDIGAINDIDVSDYNNNENTFYGRYGKIIQKIKEVNPKAKIFCITDPNSLVNNNGYNIAIRNIVSQFNDTYLIDLQAYWNNIPFKTLLENQKRYGHFNAVGYYLIAKIIMSYIDYIIENNSDDFREIENIGTDYYWY